ncbi:MAG: glycosidase, partial [Paludibacter sp.]
MIEFNKSLSNLIAKHEELLTKKNEKADNGNGVYDRYLNPVVTAAHAPLQWRYDFNPESNPYLLERIGVNATLNSGAIKWKG